MNDDEINILRNNYNRLILKNIDDNLLILLDDSEIIKKYGKKFEDLCMVKDASSLKDDIYPGYHVCEAPVVSIIMIALLQMSEALFYPVMNTIIHKLNPFICRRLKPTAFR